MFTFYEVGGHVRDGLMGLQSKDIDYVAVKEPGLRISDQFITLAIDQDFKDLSDHLREQGYQIFLETPECFTIRAKFPKGSKNEGLVADFVLARKEIGYKDGTREPIVVPGTLYDDLMRRDFTVNAIARAEDGTIIDPFNGRVHIEKKLLVTPISGHITFQGDPLRLLRAVRFAITKGFKIGATIHKIMLNFNYNERFDVVSEERIREELYKCFKHSTSLTLLYLQKYEDLANYIFRKTNLWLKPTNEN